MYSIFELMILFRMEVGLMCMVLVKDWFWLLGVELMNRWFRQVETVVVVMNDWFWLAWAGVELMNDWL